MRCELGIRDKNEWNYSIWDGKRCVRTGTLDLRNIRFHVTREMAAKLAAITEGIAA